MNGLRSARLLRAALGRSGPIEPAESDWGRWVELATTERVIPLLYEVVVASDTGLPTEQRQAAIDMQLDVAATAVRLEYELLGVAQVLSANSIPYAVLKGAATAHLDYADASQRQFGDVDLLVRPARFRDALDVLATAGWKQAYVLPRGHERFTHAITLKRSSLAELDLHQRLGHRALGELVPTEALLEARTPYEVAGQPLWALSRNDRLIHAAIHTVASRGAYKRLSSTADVLRLVVATAADADEVIARAERWHVGSLLEHAVRCSYDAAQLEVPEPWKVALGRASRRRDRLVDLAYLSPQRRPVIEEVAYLRLLGDWRERARYLTGYLLAGEDYAARTGRRGVRAQGRYLLSRLRRRA